MSTGITKEHITSGLPNRAGGPCDLAKGVRKNEMVTHVAPSYLLRVQSRIASSPSIGERWVRHQLLIGCSREQQLS